MKIERLNENQIRCTLNKSDLASRQLKINELAYGSDKAKELFRDMMQQASYELGFEADAFFALPVENFSTSAGQATNAVWGFATSCISWHPCLPLDLLNSSLQE